jgi:hypothetical protein
LDANEWARIWRRRRPAGVILIEPASNDSPARVVDASRPCGPGHRHPSVRRSDEDPPERFSFEIRADRGGAEPGTGPGPERAPGATATAAGFGAGRAGPLTGLLKLPNLFSPRLGGNAPFHGEAPGPVFPLGILHFAFCTLHFKASVLME